MNKKANAGSKSVVFLAMLFVVISILPLIKYELSGADALCMLTFYINGTVFVYHICREAGRHAFSMELMVWLFLYFFMFLAPVVQYLSSTYPWRGRIEDNEAALANAAVLGFAALFDMGRRISCRIVVGKIRKQRHFIVDPFRLKPIMRMLLCALCVLLAFWSFSKTGITGIVVSRADATRAFYSGKNSAVALLVNAFVPAFMTYVAADSLRKYRDDKSGLLFAALAVLSLMICFFPTAIPRYKMATIYGCLMLICFPKLLSGTRFTWFFVIGMFLIFPVLSSIRRNFSDSNLSRVVSDLFYSYTKGDYDAYRMLVTAIRYVRSRGCCMGSQLLGVLLFFVPKKLWPGKPGGSGAMLIKYERGAKAFSNVSCPYPAEGILNFGIIGLLFFSVLLGVLVGKCDRLYWEKNDGRTSFSPYLMLVFLIFFVMRGDLLSSYSFTLGFIVTGLAFRAFTLAPQKGTADGN